MDPEQARAQVAAVVQRAPVLAGVAERARWWLGGIRRAVPWLAECALSTVWGTLRRFGLRYKRGRRYVHSPDWEYDAKLARVATITWYARLQPARIVRLYEDELTYYRRATVGYDYAAAGADAPRARQGWGRNTARRVAACLDAATGALFAWQREHFDHRMPLRFYRALEAAYPHAEQLFVIQDNWPTHTTPALVAALRGSKITLVPLPTYAPWTNPIERAWRTLYADVLHRHPWVDAWDQLQAAVQAWLDRYAEPSPELLRYVGWACPP